MRLLPRRHGSRSAVYGTGPLREPRWDKHCVSAVERGVRGGISVYLDESLIAGAQGHEAR